MHIISADVLGREGTNDDAYVQLMVVANSRPLPFSGPWPDGAVCCMVGSNWTQLLQWSAEQHLSCGQGCTIFCVPGGMCGSLLMHYAGLHVCKGLHAGRLPALQFARADAGCNLS